MGTHEGVAEKPRREREEYLNAHWQILKSICQDLGLWNLERVRKEDFDGFSARDPESGSCVVSCPGRLIYRSSFEFGVPIPAYRLYDAFSKVCTNQLDLEKIPRGSRDVSSFSFESFLVNLENTETGEVHEHGKGIQLKKHLEVLLGLARR